MIFSHYSRSSNDAVLGIRQDKTGLLGTSIKQYGGPRYCLNGHKYFLSGWMASTTRSVDLSGGAFKGRIVAYVDRGIMGPNRAGDSTLLRIPLPSLADTFLIYNRQKSFNDGVREGGNLVTVSQTIVTDPIESNRLAMLDSNQSYAIPGTSIVIHLCSKIIVRTRDMATVSIFDTSLGQQSTCAPQFPLTTIRKPGTITAP
jgi:hypothetical protein